MGGRLADFTDWALLVACSRCHEQREIQMASLVERYGGQHKVADVVRRLRCSAPRCGAAPSAVVAFDRRLHQVPLVGPGSY